MPVARLLLYLDVATGAGISEWTSFIFKGETMTKQIQLTQGQFALVDDEDFEWLSQWKWQAAWQKNIKSFYAVRTAIKDGKKTTILMHREIMHTPDGMQCDHINHNTTDNRKTELRNCTQQENQINRKGLNSNNHTGHRGVYFEKGKFKAYIKRNNINRCLGTYSSIDEAIAARFCAEGAK